MTERRRVAEGPTYSQSPSTPGFEDGLGLPDMSDLNAIRRRIARVERERSGYAASFTP